MPVVRVSGSLLLVRASDSLLEVLEPYDSLTELLTDVVPPTPPLMSPDTTMVTATTLLPFEVNRPDSSLGCLPSSHDAITALRLPPGDTVRGVRVSEEPTPPTRRRIPSGVS